MKRMKMEHNPIPSLCSRIAPAFLVIGLALGSLLWTHQAFATATCLQDLYTFLGNRGTLGCTANDVTATVFSDLKGLESCTSGTNFTVTLQANLTLTAQTRYDIGLFVATDGGNAKTGSCLNDFLTPIADC